MKSLQKLEVGFAKAWENTLLQNTSQKPQSVSTVATVLVCLNYFIHRIQLAQAQTHKKLNVALAPNKSYEMEAEVLDKI